MRMKQQRATKQRGARHRDAPGCESFLRLGGEDEGMCGLCCPSAALLCGGDEGVGAVGFCTSGPDLAGDSSDELEFDLGEIPIRLPVSRRMRGDGSLLSDLECVWLELYDVNDVCMVATKNTARKRHHGSSRRRKWDLLVARTSGHVVRRVSHLRWRDWTARSWARQHEWVTAPTSCSLRVLLSAFGACCHPDIQTSILGMDTTNIRVPRGESCEEEEEEAGFSGMGIPAMLARPLLGDSG